MGKLIKELLFLSLVTSIFFAAIISEAEEESDSRKETASFADVKADIIKNIDARISSLERHRVCISETNDREGIVACMERHREEMMKLRPKRATGGRGRMGPGMMGPGGPDIGKD